MVGAHFKSIGTLGLVLAVASTGCHRRQASPRPPIAVQVAALKREPVTMQLRYSATVRERHRVELSFKVPGTVAELLKIPGPDGKPRDIHEGDVLSKDDARPLARLDDSDLKRRLETTQARLAQAEAKHRATTATATAIRANFVRVKSLRQRDSISQQSFEDTLARRDAVEAELDAADRDVRAATVALQQAEDDLKNCSLNMPIDHGTISRRYIEANERVAAGQPIFQIMDLSSVRVAFGVPDTKVSQFQIGQAVQVMADAFQGERFVGRITKILPAADLKTRSFEIEVTIDDPRQLKPGMVVTIVIGRHEEMILLPLTTIVRGASDGELTVYTVSEEGDEKVARQRRVKLDGVYDNRIRLVEGSASQVKEGEIVVMTGGFRLTEGQAVRVLDLQDPALRIDGQ